MRTKLLILAIGLLALTGCQDPCPFLGEPTVYLYWESDGPERLSAVTVSVASTDEDILYEEEFPLIGVSMNDTRMTMNLTVGNRVIPITMNYTVGLDFEDETPTGCGPWAYLEDVQVSSTTPGIEVEFLSFPADSFNGRYYLSVSE